MAGCPLCLANAKRWREVNGFPLWDCCSCGHRFAQPASASTHVADLYGDDYFFGGGAGYPDYLAESASLLARGRWYAEEVAKHGPAGHAMEIGAAAGFTLKAFQEAGWRAIGAEPNDAMATFGRKQLGLDLRTGGLSEIADEGPFDLCVMLQVIAHLVDLRSDLETIATAVRPGGFCLIETWDRGSLPARLMGTSWHEYSPPSVLHWFSLASLDEQFDHRGFDPVAVGRPKKWISGAHVKSLLKHSAERSVLNRLLRFASTPLPDKLQLPYPSWDLFWRLYRKR